MARSLPTLFALVISIGAAHGLSSCVKKDVCSCESDQGLIDLRPLDSSSGPAFSNIPDVDTTSGYHFSYNPCTDYTESQSGTSCTNVAACQVGAPPTAYPLGTHDSAAFSVDDSGKAQVQYTATGSDGNLRTATVSLVCDPNTEKTMTYNGESVLVYSFTLTSKSCCPGSSGGGGGGGLSTGSVLCIILTVLVVVYLVGGVLYMTYQKGATGVERIPNIDFWKDLPALVKDGVMFTVHCGKGSSTYSEI